ncbi:hypothetical protein [Pontibacter cellulosilyticus]|uniref:Uncharacterized protein n=1 Tax=Pontibacter cellulosilyticus TaxID=1720253 RepID=A0A923SJQ0_9BACT|nr:hypothetical protein [Pontibacter cellulosilyticus]MBC5993907.1 hypothetical protein [Pontibacter cellulosilyticus]
MNRFLNYIAVLLLLLFIRVMVPDALLLQLHAHGHTVHTEQTDSHKAQVGKKHTHCPVEDLFGAPYQMAGDPVAFTPVQHITIYSVHYSSSWHGTTLHNASLRGPPVS